MDYTFDFEARRTTRPRKNYFDSSERSKRRARAELQQYYDNFSTNFERRYGLKIKRIEFVDKDCSTDKIDLVILNNCDSIISKEIMIYKAKESTNLSDKSFQHFVEAGANFPTIFKAKKFQLKLNSVFKTYGNSRGYYFDPEEKFRFYLKIFKNFINIDDDILKIRLAGDGTQIGKSLSVFNFSFSFLNKIKFEDSEHPTDTPVKKTFDPNRVDSNFLLGCFKIEEENHAELEFSLKDIVLLLEQLNEISMEDKTYKIEYFLGGDLKFLALALGLQAAQSYHPCPWCESHKTTFPDNIHNHHPNRVLTDRPIGRGYKEIPLFKFIKIENVIVDILHLFLRVSDKLFELLYRNIEQLDRGWKTDIKDNKNLYYYVNVLESLNIKKPYYKDGSSFKFRNFNGDERNKIFQNMNFEKFFPQMKNSNLKQEVWDSFYDLMYDIKDELTSSVEVKSKTKIWFDKFLQITFKLSTIPYIHIMISHLFQQVDSLKSKGLYINSFSMQGIEKLNDFTTQYYQRSSNKKSNFIWQVLQKRSRKEILDHHADLLSLLNV